jgi:hypothetical protein
MTMVNLHIASISIIISKTIILAIGVVSIALTELGNSGIAQGQVSNSTPSSLIPQQKSAMCNPNNPKLNFVNSTESKICSIPSTPTNTTTTTPAANTTTPTIANQSRLYRQGYVKGVADAKSVQVTTAPTSTMMKPDDVDCDSSVDPQTSNVDYCSGYQNGYPDTYNNELLGK